MMRLAWIFLAGAVMALFAMASQAGAMDPLDPGDALDDPDGDGLINVVEFEHGADPNNPDTDADGLPDGWEVRYYLDRPDHGMG